MTTQIRGLTFGGRNLENSKQKFAFITAAYGGQWHQPLKGWPLLFFKAITQD